MRTFLAVTAKVAFVLSSLIVATLPASADDCLNPSSTQDVNCPISAPFHFIPLVNVGSDKCFEPNPAANTAGLPIQQQTCGTFDPTLPTIQSYQFQPLGYVIYNDQPPWYCPFCIKLGAQGFFIENFITFTSDGAASTISLCLDVRDGAKNDGAVVQQWTCRDSSARSMVWYVSKGDFPGAFKIRNVNSDLCLDVKGGSSAEGAQLQQYHCTSNNRAQNFWQITSRGTVMDLDGNWTDGSTRSAHIFEGPGTSASILIDMSAFGRPNATGSIMGPSTITVNFPDDKTYTGQIQPPATIKWSNGSAWTRD